MAFFHRHFSTALPVGSLLLLGAVLPGSGRAAEIPGEVQRLLELKTAELPRMALAPETEVYGTVLSPAPLIDLFRQSEAARALVAMSAEALTRVRQLHDSGQLVAAKDVQASLAQSIQNEVALQAIEDRIALEWGPVFAGMAEAERKQFVEALLKETRILVRLSVPFSGMGGAGEVTPKGARLHVPGRDTEQLHCDRIVPAKTVDPVYQARPFLGILTAPAGGLPPGTALAGALELEGKARSGFRVATDSVVFFLGKAWAFRKTGEETFERIEIPLDEPVNGGWFVAEDAINPKDIVSSAVQSLLSQETLTRGEE